MTIVKYEFRANFKSLLIWSISIGGMILAFMLMFPMLEDTLSEMGDMYKNMEGFSAAFGLDKLSIFTPMGYYGTEVGAVLSLGGALFGALLGANMLSKEEGGHTAEFLLSAPISRASVVFQKFIAMLVILGVFELVCMTMAIVSFVIIGGSLDTQEFLLYHLAQACMHLEIACICFCISAFIKKANVGLGLGIALILYFLDILVKTVPNLDYLRFFTPYYYAGAPDIFTTGKLDGGLFSIGIIVSILTVTIAYVKYTKKDIAA